MNSASNKNKFNTIMNLLIEKMEDEFWAEGDVSTEEQERMIGEIIVSHGFTNVDPDLLKSINDLVCSGACDFYYSEYAGNAPGPRSSHRNCYLRSKTILKNRVRKLCALPVKGVEELKELEAWLEGRGQFIVHDERPIYTKMGKLIALDIVDCFGLKKTLAETLVGVCGDRYGYGKAHGAKTFNESSNWNAEHLEYAAILIAQARKKGQK